MASNVGFRELLSMVVGFLVAFVLTTSGGIIQSSHSPDTRWILFVLMVLALGCIAVVRWHYTTNYELHGATTDHDDGGGQAAPPDQLEHLIEEFALPLGILVFGGGSIMLHAFYLMADFQCFKFYVGDANTTTTGDDDADDKLYAASTRINFNLAAIVFFGVQIPFLGALHRLQYRAAPYMMHHSVLFIACVFYKESGLIPMDGVKYGVTSLTQTVTLERACYNFSSAVDIYTTSYMEHPLFPFISEFMIASLEVLLHVWLLPRSPSYVRLRRLDAPALPAPLPAQPPADTPVDLTASENFDDVHRELIQHEDITDQHPRDKVTNTRWQSVYSVLLRGFNLYTAIVTGIIESVLLQYYTLNYTAAAPGWGGHYLHSTGPHPALYAEHNNQTYLSKDEFDLTVNVPTVVFRLLASALPATLVSIYCAWLLSNSRIVRPNESRISANYIVLALAIGGNIILATFELVVVVTKIRDPNKRFRFSYLIGLTEAICYGVQFVAQALVIYYGQRRLPCTRHRFYRLLQGRLSYLVMFNFIHWFIDSFLEVHFLSLRNEYAVGEGEGLDPWTIVVHLCIPPCIYYRYISTVLLLRVKRLIREPDQLDIEEEERRVDPPAPHTPALTVSGYGTFTDSTQPHPIRRHLVSMPSYGAFADSLPPHSV